MHNILKRPASALLPLALVIALVIPAFAQYRATVPVGTIVPLRMDTYLSSNTSRVGDRFTATVSQDVTVNGRVVVPSGAKVEGHVTGTTPARSQSRAGSIAVAFDRLAYSEGTSVPVDGTLTTLDAAGRRELGIDNVDNEDRVEGNDRTRRAIVFIGGGAGAGAIIGAIAGGGKGAAVGAGVGAVLGTIGVLLGKGDSAEVKPGTEFGMMVERSFSVDTNRLGVASDRDVRDPDPSFNQSQGSAQVDYNSYESIRFAQIALRDRGFYNGPINGQMNMATRNAIRQFQRDRNFSMTGDIDFRTAHELGIVGESGMMASDIEINAAQAERIGPDSIRINVDVHTRGSGWQVFANNFVSGNTLHVYVRGTAPRFSSGGGSEHHPFTQTFNNMRNVTRVIFHGPQRDIPVDLLGGNTGGNTGNTGNVGGNINLGNARQIGFLANRLLQSYQRDLNIRSNRGQVVFDTTRDLKPSEVDLLLQLHSLRAMAEVYSQLVGATDQDVLRGAADSLIRQLRITNRVMNRSGIAVSNIVKNDWEQLRTEIRSITGTDNDIDRDFDR